MSRKGSHWLIALALIGLAAVTFALVFHPSRPLYLREMPLDFVSADGTRLAATLSLPRWTNRPVPAVILVHGSGPLGRADLRGDVRRLVWEGFAVLAYDKRGVGASGGTYPRGWGEDAESVLRVLARDAAAAFEQARRDPAIDSSRVGFFGASQASWIIPLAAAELRPPPRFHVILSGAAVSTEVEALYSRLTGDGVRPPQLADRAEIEKRVGSYSGPSGFDPAPILERLAIPTLWLLGGRDESVPTFATVAVIEALRRTGNRFHTVVVYPDANHGLRSVETGESAPIWADMLRWLHEIDVIRHR